MRAYASALTATTVPDNDQGPQLEVGSNVDAFYLLEAGVFNSTTTAFTAGVGRYTAGGTAGAALTEISEDPDYTPNVVATGVNSTAATITGGAGTAYVQAAIGAAIGAGVIWTFGGKGLRCPGTADNGFIILIPSGTGQHFHFYWVWEE